MSTHRTRHRQKPAVLPKIPEPDTTELELRELVALWPRLEAALARDGAGPSAAPSGGGGGGPAAGSPAVIDLDTERVRTLIALGVHEVEAEAIRILNITPPDKVIARLRAQLVVAQQRRNTARAVLLKLRRLDRRLTVDEHITAVTASADVYEARKAIAELTARVARVQYRCSTLGVLEKMPTWYALLRDREQPLAEHIAKDVRRWRRDARSVLRLQTREQSIGWTCPNHRDAPAVLVRDRDEATLDPAVIAGRRLADGTAPLVWRRAETVHCPTCKTKWVGVEQMRILMRMIDRVELEEYMTEQLTKALEDEHLKILLWLCGECGKASSRDAWSTALWAERDRRRAGKGISAEELAEYEAEGSTSKFGLADREVCPRCGFVHADNDGPGIEEVPGVAVALP
jgi:hypothetical protein